MNLYLAKETINSFTKGKVKLLHPKAEKNDLLFVSAPLLHPYDRGSLLRFVFLGKTRTKYFHAGLLSAPQPPSSMSSSAARMYSTLLHLTNTSPRFPVQEPSMNSSVLANLYSCPHLSLTMTALPVRPLRKGFGFMGIDAILDLEFLSLVEVNQAIK